MAPLAEERALGHEKFVVVRPVGRVAGGAVLLHRGMFPEERAALFGVTLVAGLVEDVGLDVLVRGRPVRIVTIGATDLALADRVVGELLQVRLDVQVAGDAEIRGVRLGQVCVVAAVDFVATRAAQALALVGTGIPVLSPSLVAFHAGVGLLGHRDRSLATVALDRGAGSFLGVGVQVAGSRAVAMLAGLSCSGAAGVNFSPVGRGPEAVGDILVALHTDVTAHEF